MTDAPQRDGIPQLLPQQARDRMEKGAVLVDVREMPEWRQARIPGAVHMPLSQLQQEYAQLPEDRPLILQCAAGARSQDAARFLQQHGYQVANMAQGIHGWWSAGLPLESG